MPDPIRLTRAAAGKASKSRSRRAAAGLCFAATAILTSALVGAARSQVIDQLDLTGLPGYEVWLTDAVADHPLTEYDSLGVKAGSFIIRPQISQSFGYNTNILNESPALSSPVSHNQGQVYAESDWSRNALNLFATVDNVNYLQHQNVSYTDWSAGMRGHVDIGRDQLGLTYSHTVNTSLPNDVGALGLTQPVTYSVDDIQLSYTAKFARVTLVPAFDVQLYRFGTSTGGPLSINEVGNDRNIYTGSLAAGYELAPARSLVLLLSGSNGTYTTKTRGVPTPNYNDATVLGGIDYRLSGPFRYRVLLGYEQRSNVSSKLPNFSAPITELDLIWTPTQLTTVTGRVTRSIQSSISTGAGSYAYTSGKLLVDHEYLRNVLLEGYGEVERSDYKANKENQTVYSAGASVTWKLNRRVQLTGLYSFSKTNDNVDKPLNTNRNLAEVRVTLQL